MQSSVKLSPLTNQRPDFYSQDGCPSYRPTNSVRALQLLSQLQNITAPWPVPNYTALTLSDRSHEGKAVQIVKTLIVSTSRDS